MINHDNPAGLISSPGIHPTTWIEDEWPDERLVCLQNAWRQCQGFYIKEAKKQLYDTHDEKRFVRWLFTRGTWEAQFVWTVMRDSIEWHVGRGEYRVISWRRRNTPTMSLLFDEVERWHVQRSCFLGKRLFILDLKLGDLTMTRWQKLERDLTARAVAKLQERERQLQTEQAITQLTPPRARARDIENAASTFTLQATLRSLCTSQ